MKLLPIKPSIKNPKYWFPDRPNKSEWDKIRKVVLTRDSNTCRFCGHVSSSYMNLHHVDGSTDNNPKNLLTCCVACHAVQHLGKNLQLGIIEIWKSPFTQLEIIKMSRDAIRKGKTLKQVNKTLKLSKGLYPPSSLDYANAIIDPKSKTFTFYLDDPLRVVFVNLNRWQTEE
jgi:hypothetical protein